MRGTPKRHNMEPTGATSREDINHDRSCKVPHKTAPNRQLESPRLQKRVTHQVQQLTDSEKGQTRYRANPLAILLDTRQLAVVDSSQS